MVIITFPTFLTSKSSRNTDKGSTRRISGEPRVEAARNDAESARNSESPSQESDHSFARGHTTSQIRVGRLRRLRKKRRIRDSEKGRMSGSVGPGNRTEKRRENENLQGYRDTLLTLTYA